MLKGSDPPVPNSWVAELGTGGSDPICSDYFEATLKDARACCKSRSRESIADPPDPRFEDAGDFDSSLIKIRPLADGARSMQIRSPDSTCAVEIRLDKGKTKYRSMERFK